MQLEELVKEFQGFKQSILEYIAGLKQWQENTTEYRKQLCAKVDNIIEKLSLLPCEKQKGKLEAIKSQMAVMWFILGGVALAVFVEWIKKR